MEAENVSRKLFQEGLNVPPTVGAWSGTGDNSVGSVFIYQDKQLVHSAPEDLFVDEYTPSSPQQRWIKTEDRRRAKYVPVPPCRWSATRR